MFRATSSQAGAAAASAAGARPPGIMCPDLHRDRLDEIKNSLQKPDMISALQKELEALNDYIKSNGKAPGCILTPKFKELRDLYRELFANKWARFGNQGAEMPSMNKDDEQFLKFLLENYGIAPVHDVLTDVQIKLHVADSVENLLLRQGWNKENSWVVPVCDENGKRKDIRLHMDYLKEIKQYMKEIVDHFLTNDPKVIEQALKLNKGKRLLNGGHNTFGASEWPDAFANWIAWAIKLNKAYMLGMAKLTGIPLASARVTANRVMTGPPDKVNKSDDGNTNLSAHWDRNPADALQPEKNTKKVQSKVVFTQASFAGLIGCTSSIVKWMIEKGLLPNTKEAPKKQSLFNLGQNTLFLLGLHSLCTECRLPLRPGGMAMWLSFVVHLKQPPSPFYRFGDYGYLPVEEGTTAQTNAMEVFKTGCLPNSYANPKPEPIANRGGTAKRKRNFPGQWQQDMDKMDMPLCKEIIGFEEYTHETKDGVKHPAYKAPPAEKSGLDKLLELGFKLDKEGFVENENKDVYRQASIKAGLIVSAGHGGAAAGPPPETQESDPKNVYGSASNPIEIDDDDFDDNRGSGSGSNKRRRM